MGCEAAGGADDHERRRENFDLGALSSNRLCEGYQRPKEAVGREKSAPCLKVRWPECFVASWGKALLFVKHARGSGR